MFKEMTENFPEIKHSVQQRGYTNALQISCSETIKLKLPSLSLPLFLLFFSLGKVRKLEDKEQKYWKEIKGPDLPTATMETTFSGIVSSKCKEQTERAYC